MSELLIDKFVHIRRPPATVFAAWSTAEALAKWFAPMAEQPPDVSMEFAVGGCYSIRMPLPDGSVHTTRGEFREIVPDEKIVMTLALRCVRRSCIAGRGCIQRGARRHGPASCS